ncbi:hypothetical protein [Anaerospora hongkongensis]|uniref:hypothetical protein n=1 Tax=Anaerospora hongkongensis TaxID=244830 RepID=UPI00289718B4|nr:hypothetical protein [Anaerospora hongkongensis]
MDETAIGMVMGGAFLVIFLFLLFALFKKMTGMRNTVKATKQLHKEKMNSIGAINCICAKHMTGLPVAEGTECFVYLCSNMIVFERNETSFNLLIEKIKDIVIKTDTEIQKSHVSSIGRAVVGGVLFGPLGAIVGGRSKEKTSSIESKYLIFTYDKSGEIDYISFDVTKIPDAYKFLDFWSKIPKEKKEIAL